MAMNMQFLMKQAQKIQNDITKAQKQLEEKEYEGTAGGGAIVVKAKGNYHVEAVTIDPELMKEDVADVEVMVTAAMNEVLDKIAKDRDAILTPITGGAKFPGAL